MKLILAGLFVYAGIVIVGVMLADPARRISPFIDYFATITAFISLLTAALVIFNFPRKRLKTGQAKLQEQGLLIATDYHAMRAFRVEGYDDKGSHYFIELIDKTVLYLNGPYLDNYEPTYENDSAPQPSPFPSTKLQVRRHPGASCAIDVVCAGDPLPLEASIDIETITPPSPKNDCLHGITLSDGLIISTTSYGKIKRRFASPDNHGSPN